MTLCAWNNNIMNIFIHSLLHTYTLSSSMDSVFSLQISLKGYNRPSISWKNRLLAVILWEKFDGLYFWEAIMVVKKMLEITLELKACTALSLN